MKAKRFYLFEISTFRMIQYVWCAVIAGIVLTATAHAAILTVDNNPNPAGQYATLQEAHDAASDGDIIHVFPSAIAYSGINVTKRLAIYGAGFNPSKNPGWQASVISTKISGKMTFADGSDHSELAGFSYYFDVDIDADSITVKRNEVKNTNVLSNHIGIIFIQNISSGSYNFRLNDGCDAYLANNYFSNFYSNYDIITTDYRANCAVYNNIFYAKYSSIDINLNGNSVFVNNIVINGHLHVGGDSYYNMCNAEQLPEGNGNIRNVDMSTVFVNMNTDTEYFEYGDYHLKPGSPAIGTGEMGVDMGIYGGATPFVDGGIPDIPTIYSIKMGPADPTQGLDVIIKARTNP